MKVRDIMTTELFFLTSDQKIDLAGDIMEWHHLRHIPVVGKDRELLGLVTHRDLLRTSISVLAGFPKDEERELQHEITIESVMKKDIQTTTPDTDLRQAASIMIDGKFGCLPVLEGGKLLGIVTEADFLTLAWDTRDAKSRQKDFASTRKYGKSVGESRTT